MVQDGWRHFPVLLVDGVSLLPEARWGVLSRAPEAGAQPNCGGSPAGASQDGGLSFGCAPAPGARERASLFWHALSPSNSLLLTWENALVGRDPNCPTNLQAELYAAGRNQLVHGNSGLEDSRRLAPQESLGEWRPGY